jgi:putative membrane protein
MMYYGGGGWAGWIGMGLSMIVFWAVVIGVAVWAVRSFTREPEVKAQKSAALGILEERYARGEISPEEFTKGKQLIQGP